MEAPAAREGEDRLGDRSAGLGDGCRLGQGRRTGQGGEDGHGHRHQGALAQRAGEPDRGGAALPRPDHVVGSSKAIRSLAKLAGYPVPGWSGIDRMVLPRKQLKDWIPRLAQIPADAREALPGITADRTFQIVAAAVVVHQAMKAMDVDELEVSPWALREGVLLRYIEELDGV